MILHTYNILGSWEGFDANDGYLKKCQLWFHDVQYMAIAIRFIHGLIGAYNIL